MKILISKNDKKIIKKIIKRLNSAHEFNWKIVEEMETLNRVLTNHNNFTKYFKSHKNKANCQKQCYFDAVCIACGWWGCSEFLLGGGQIADSGDYNDGECPICTSINIGDK